MAVARTTEQDFVSFTLGENVSLGDVLTLDTAGDAVRAVATFSSDAWRTAAIARSAGSAASAITVALSGSLVPTRFASAPAAASNNDPVFLSTTLGEATLTPPISSGSVIYVVGILQGADGVSVTPDVVFQPQYISRVP